MHVKNPRINHDQFRVESGSFRVVWTSVYSQLLPSCCGLEQGLVIVGHEVVYWQDQQDVSRSLMLGQMRSSGNVQIGHGPPKSSPADRVLAAC